MALLEGQSKALFTARAWGWLIHNLMTRNASMAAMDVLGKGAGVSEQDVTLCFHNQLELLHR